MANEIEQQRRTTLSGNLVYSFLVTVIIGIVNIIYPIMVGLFFGPNIMGKISVLFYWSILLTIPISNGIAPAISRFSAALKLNEKKSIENIGSKLSIYYLLGVLLVYPILGIFIFDLNGIELVLVLILLTSLVIHYLFRSSFQGQEKFSYLFKIELISFLVFIPFMVFFGILPKILEWTKITTVYYYLIIPILAFHLAFALFIFILKFKEINIKSLFRLPKITKNILLYALLIGLGGLLAFGLSKVQIIITDLYLKDEFELGVLSFWDSGIAAITVFTVALSGILVPRVTNLQKVSNNEESNHAAKFVNSLNWAITMIVSSITGLLVLLIGAYPVILEVLTLYKYNMSSYWLVVVLLVFKEINFLMLTPSLSYILSSEKHVKINPISSLIASIFIIISWIFLVPRFGIIGLAGGIAIGGLIQSIIILTLTLIISRRKIGMHLPLMLGFYSFNSVFLLLLVYTSLDILFIALWVILSSISLTIGTIIIIRLLRKQEYSKSFDAKSFKEDIFETKNDKLKSIFYEKPLIYTVLAKSYFTDPRVKQEVESLNKYGFSVYVLSWDREVSFSNYLSGELVVDNRKLIQSKAFSKILFFISALLFQISIFFTGLKLLKRKKKIILHINDFNTIIGSVLLKILFPRKIKLVYDSHELTHAVYSEWYCNQIGSLTGQIEKILLSFMDEIITVSPPIKTYLERISSKKVNIIWNYPLKKFIPKISKKDAKTKLGFNKEDFLITYVGSLRNDVALIELVDAIDNINKKKKRILDIFRLKVVIVGDGPLLSTLLTRVKNYKLEKYISVIGRVDREKSFFYIKASDLSYVLFSIKGMNTKIGMPWKLFESVSCKTKVLVMENTYASKFVTQHNFGYTIDSIETNDLVNNLLTIIENYDHIRENELNSYWEIQENQFVSIYKNLRQK